MKSLTKAEEQVMQHLWDLNKAFLKELADAFIEPKPAYSTISTMVRILIDKGFIGFKKYGRDREYYPLVEREEYLKGQFKGVLNSYFHGSFSQFASFYTGADNMNMEELREIQQIINDQIKNHKPKK